MNILDQFKERPGRALMGVALLGIGLAFFVDWLVITDAEQIEVMLLDARDRFEAGDAAGVMACFAQSYGGADIPLDRIRREVERKRWRGVSVSVGHIEFEPEDPRQASSRITARATAEDGVLQQQPLWLKFVKIGDDWRIVAVNVGPGR